MNRIFHLLIVLILPLMVFSQDQYSARMPISGTVSELGISPSEEVWAATAAGNVYYTKQAGQLWHYGPFGSPNSDNLGSTFERINFFSEDTLMISGFIQENNRQDFVYWSGNHGRSWEKVVFGKSSWLDGGYINNHGKAWMSGNSQLIYYTTNRGQTWKSFDKVEPTGNLRFETIFFAKDEKTGLFGAVWNVIYKTTNNCRSWQKLPTPLDQKKYLRLSNSVQPRIEKIKIFGNYYIVKEEGKTFITKSDTINWIYQPKITDYEVTENGNLYTVNSDLTVSLYNSDFISTWQSEQKMETAPRAVGVKNNKLFALTFESLYKITAGEFTSSPLLTNETEIPDPDLKLSFEGEKLGVDNRDILCFDTTTGKWYRLMTLDFPIANATIFENKLIVYNESKNRYFSIDPKSKTSAEFKLPANLFANKNAKKIYFEHGYRGCFDAANSRRLYTKQSGEFVVNKDSSSSKYLSGAMEEIDEATVQKLIDEIEHSRLTTVSLADLDIAESDIEKFKWFIDKQARRLKKRDYDPFDDHENLYTFPGENADFSFYKSAASNLFKLSETDINDAFWQAYGNWSTTTVWNRIIFIFQDGKKLIVENADDKPNYLYTPWMVNYDGLRFKTNSIKLGQYINTVTNREFFDKDANDKNYAIFKITDYLYRKQIQEK